MAKMNFNDSVRFDPNTTLFITDLDGTLLTKNATLPPQAKEMIEELHKAGVRLTFSTARTIRSAAFILEGIPFSAPISLMNGVLIRDMNEGRYVSGNLLPQSAAKEILEAGGEPFVYTLSANDELFTSYRRLANEHMENFLKERVDKYSKPFRKLENFTTLVEENQRIIYFCYLDTYKNLLSVYERITAMKDPNGNSKVKCAFYPDRYREGLWYLEVFSASASKGTSTRVLKEITSIQTVVCFGDNGNDLPMFEESDYAFAVEHASEDVKKAACGIVPPEIGVIEFIAKHIKEG